MQGKLGNVLTLNTNRISADSRFEIVQSPLENEEPSNMIKRQNSQKSQQKFHYLNYYHLKINGVQINDENEYACETTISQSDDQENLQSLVHLKVTRKKRFFLKKLNVFF